MLAYATKALLGDTRYHYWHFMAGYFFPVMTQDPPVALGEDRFHQAHNDAKTVFVADCGPMNKMWEGIKDRKVKVGFPPDTNPIWLDAFDRFSIENLTIGDITRFRHNIWNNFNRPDASDLRKRAFHNFTIVHRGSAPSEYEELGRTSGRERRKFQNEKEINDALLGYKNFNIFYPEEHTLEKQAQMFYKSDVVVMQHGAAMFNAIFMRPCSILIEVGERAWAFEGWARYCGVRRYFMKVKSFHDPINIQKLIKIIHHSTKLTT